LDASKSLVSWTLVWRLELSGIVLLDGWRALQLLNCSDTGGRQAKHFSKDVMILIKGVSYG